MRDQSSEGEACNYSQKKKRLRGRERVVHTHTPPQCMRKCYIRADSSCYEVLTSAQRGEDPALWWTTLRLSVGSALFTVVIGSDRIVKVRYWCLCMHRWSLWGEARWKPQSRLLDSWPLTSDLNNTELKPWPHLLQSTSDPTQPSSKHQTTLFKIPLFH